MRILLATAILLSVASPAFGQDAPALGSTTKNIASAVDGAVRYDANAAGLPDGELIVYATRGQNSLLKPFNPRQGWWSTTNSPYTIDLRRDGKWTAVLVCDATGALYEDAGCTGPVDRNAVGKGEPCGFVLDLKQTCEKKR